jgi:hypothetical protein
MIGICTADRMMLNKIKVESSEEMGEAEVGESEKQESHSVLAEVPPHFIQIQAGCEEVRCLYYRNIFNSSK